MELRKILDLAKKWVLVVALAILVGGAAGFVVSILQPKVYESDTELYFSSPNHTDYNSILGAQQAAKAFASLPLSNSVMQATLQSVGDHSLSLTQFASMVNITNNLNSQYVIVGVRDQDPILATRLTKELVRQSMLQFEAGATDSGRTRQFLQHELSNLADEIKSLEQKINAAQNQTTTAPQGVPVSQLREGLSADRTLYNQLLSSYNLMSDTQITVVQDAQVPQKPFGQGKALAIAIGAIVGLIAILGVILLIEQTDDVLRTAEKVNRATGLATLMSVAYSPTASQALYATRNHKSLEDAGITTVEPMAVEPVAVAQTAYANEYLEVPELTATVKLVTMQTSLLTKHSEQAENREREAEARVQIPETPPIGEAHKVSEHTDKHLAVHGEHNALKTTHHETDNSPDELPIEFLTLGVLLSSYSEQKAANATNTGSLLVVSSEKGDGKTHIAAQIALGLARVGVETVMLDANLHEPGIHKIFDLPNKYGLSSLLTGGTRLDDALIASVLQKTYEPHLSLLPAGPGVTSSSAILSSPRMATILQILSKNAVIIIDSPAVLAASDAVVLAKRCESVLMVVDSRRTRIARLKRALEILTQVNANVLGVILNRTSNKE